MNAADVNRIARLLVSARESGKLADALDHDSIDIAPETLDDVYQIQSAVAALTGTVGGRKTGADSAEAVPVAAPVFVDKIYPSGTTLAPGSMRLVGLEAELAFRLGRDLPAGDAPYTEDAIMMAIDCMLPLIELVDSRLRDFDSAGALWKLADNQINSGFVTGQPISDWQQMNLADQPVVLSADQQVIAQGSGWNFDGSAIGLVVRFVNRFVDHCGGIRAGQIITTGSLTGIDFIEAGATVSADFAHLGSVSVTIE